MFDFSLTRFASMVALVALLTGTTYGISPVWDIADEDYGTDTGTSMGSGFFASPSSFQGFFAGAETLHADYAEITAPDGFTGQIHTAGSLSLPSAFRIEWRMAFTHNSPGGVTQSFRVKLPNEKTVEVNWHAPQDGGVQLYSPIGPAGALSDSYNYGDFHTYILEVDTNNATADYVRLWVDGDPATDAATIDASGGDIGDAAGTNGPIQFNMNSVHTTKIDYFRMATIPFIPEPATAGLMVLGAATMLWRRRR